MKASRVWISSAHALCFLLGTFGTNDELNLELTLGRSVCIGKPGQSEVKQVQVRHGPSKPDGLLSSSGQKCSPWQKEGLEESFPPFLMEPAFVSRQRPKIAGGLDDHRFASQSTTSLHSNDDFSSRIEKSEQPKRKKGKHSGDQEHVPQAFPQRYFHNQRNHGQDSTSLSFVQSPHSSYLAKVLDPINGLHPSLSSCEGLHGHTGEGVRHLDKILQNSDSVEVDRLVYAWIGTIPDTPDSHWMKISHNASNLSKYIGKTYPLANCLIGSSSVSNSHLREKHKKDSAGISTGFFKDRADVMVGIGLLFKKVYCLNKRILSLYGINSTNESYTEEHNKLFTWLLGVFTGQESQKSSIVHGLYVYARLLSISQIQEDPIVLKFPVRGQDVIIKKKQELIIELAINVLGSYYKTINIKKWTAIFDRDINFLKLMTKIALSLKDGGYAKWHGMKRDFFMNFCPIPWIQEWGDLKLQLAKEQNPFRDFEFERPVTHFIRKHKKLLPNMGKRGGGWFGGFQDKFDIRNLEHFALSFDCAKYFKTDKRDINSSTEDLSYAIANQGKRKNYIAQKIVDYSPERVQKLYAWIGSLHEERDSFLDYILLYLRNKLLTMLETEDWIEGSDHAMSVFKEASFEFLQLLHNELKTKNIYNEINPDFNKSFSRDTISMHQDAVISKFLQILKKIYVINKWFLDLLRITPNKYQFESEQRNILNWVLRHLTPVEYETMQEDNISHDQAQKLRDMTVSFLRSEENELVLVTQTTQNGKQQELRQQTQLCAKISINLLITYYKSTNLQKWQAIFPDDDDFIKLISLIRYKTFKERYFLLQKQWGECFKGHDVIPWDTKWPFGKRFWNHIYEKLRRPLNKPITHWLIDIQDQNYNGA